MRILLLSHYYAPEFGAPQRRWGAIIPRLLRAGHQVVVAAPPPHYPEGRVPAVHRGRHRAGCVERGTHGELILRTAYLPHRGDILTRSLDHAVAALDAARRALRHLGGRGRRPDVIIATAPAIETIVVGRLLGAWWGVPVVVEMRDAWPDLVTHMHAGIGPHSDLRSLLVGRLKREVHRRVTQSQTGSARVVTTTEQFAGVLRERGIREVEVVRNGTDLERVPFIDGRNRTGAGQGGLHCLYLGNMGRSQGLEVVVEAAARLAAEGVDIRVRMVGHGSEARALGALAARLGAPVSISTRVPHDQVGELYAWADTVIVSLRDWEPFRWTIPSKLYELLATGRHVTGIVGGESAGILLDTGAGDLVPPGDVVALTQLWRGLAADPQRVAPRREGRRWVAQHADDSVLAAQYLALLTSLHEA
ncbi:MAG: glycosyltransferase family 4 protein [Brachybacterium sp.]|nr:glycosyltransferase family 4 protein [Brachybacterium sp.]